MYFCLAARDERKGEWEMESVFWIIFFLAAGIFYLRVLGDYGVRNLTAANIFMLFLGKYCDTDISTEVRFAKIFMLLAAVALYLGFANWKYAEVLTCQLFLFYCFVLQWPDFYLKLYPYNNLEEDFGWGIYSTQIVYTMFAAACVVLLVFWILNRTLWKGNLLRLLNAGIGSIIFWQSIKTALSLLEVSRQWEPLWWAAAFGAAFFLCRREPQKQKAGRMAVMGLSLLLFAGLWAGVMEYVQEREKPKVTVYETERYEYLVMGNKELEEDTVFFNERGEKVLQIECNFVQGVSFSDGYLICISDITGIYLINEKGEFLGESYEPVSFIPAEDLVLALDPETEKYGALDSSGEVQIPFRYDSQEELQEKELTESVEKGKETLLQSEGLRITGEIGAMGVSTKDGKEILPQTFWEIGFFTNGSGLIWADTGFAREYEVYDTKGKKLFTSEGGIWDDCENGWFRTERWQDEQVTTYFLNDKFEKVLVLEEGYKADRGFQKVR